MGHAITPTDTRPTDRAKSIGPADGRRRQDIETVELALAIADAAVRSDIELHALGFYGKDGLFWYDLKQPAAGITAPEIDAELRQVVARAVRYITQRGDVFPWRLFHSFGDRSIVRFEAKP